MIPQFPQAKRLELSDKEEITAYTRMFPPYSDFNFTSMWSYDTDHLFEISWLNENLVVKFQDYVDLRMFYSFLGTKDTVATAEQLLNKSHEEGINSSLHLVPSICVRDIINSGKFIISDDRDNFDYIISAQEFGDMSGAKYHKKRNMVTRFLRENGASAKITKLDLHDNITQEKIVRLFDIWVQIFHKDRKESEHEFRAIQKLIEGLESFNLQSYGVEIGGGLAGFLIAEIQHDGYAIRHFEKPDVRFHGITEYFQKETAAIFTKQGCRFMNYEQDLGLEGLRQAKMLCHPEHFLEKYTISLKGQLLCLG